MRSKLFIAAAIFAALTTLALGPIAVGQPMQGGAPQSVPANVRGTIERLGSRAITVEARDGSMNIVTLAPNYRISALVRKKLSDIHAGDFVGATSVPGKDGKLHATEIHIFPPALRGVGEGQLPWDTQPNAIMTNATVTGVAKAMQGQVLSVNYKGSTAQIIVDPNTIVVGPSPKGASIRDLKPGQTVYIFARRNPDGSLTTNNITVEKNGVKPPM
jgi:Domain of unknown function (DUF5666)